MIAYPLRVLVKMFRGRKRKLPSSFDPGRYFGTVDSDNDKEQDQPLREDHPPDHGDQQDEEQLDIPDLDHEHGPIIQQRDLQNIGHPWHGVNVDVNEPMYEHSTDGEVNEHEQQPQDNDDDDLLDEPVQQQQQHDDDLLDEPVQEQQHDDELLHEPDQQQQDEDDLLRQPDQQPDRQDQQQPHDDQQHFEPEQDVNNQQPGGREEDDTEDEDTDYHSLLENFYEAWMLTELEHTVSKTASNAFWSAAFKFIPPLIEAKSVQNITRKVPTFNHIRRTLHRNLTPDVNLEIGYRCNTSNEVTVVNAKSMPRSKFPGQQYEKLYEVATVKVIYPNKSFARRNFFIFWLQIISQIKIITN